VPVALAQAGSNLTARTRPRCQRTGTGDGALVAAVMLVGGFVAHAAGLRAPYIVAGILCALSMLAALPFLLSAGRD
jgi:hypothetical protein